MIQRVQTKQKQSPAGGLLSDTGRRRGGGQIALREGRREGGSAKLPGGGGGGARRSQSAPHIHVLVCICSNVEAVHSAL